MQLPTTSSSRSSRRDPRGRLRPSHNLPSTSLPDRQYSDEFEEPINSFTAEQDDNGEEPSVSIDGSRVLEDLIASVGKSVLPAISSSDDDEEQFPSASRYSRERAANELSRGRRSSRHAHSDGSLSTKALFSFPSKTTHSNELECVICGETCVSEEILQAHVELHARNQMYVDHNAAVELAAARQSYNRTMRRRSTSDRRDLVGFYPSGQDDDRLLVQQPQRQFSAAVRRRIEKRRPTFLDIPRDITNMVFDFLHPMDWTRSCALVNNFFWNVSLFKWGRVDIYALQGLSSKQRRGEERRAVFLGQHATRLKTLIVENCGIEANSFITLTENLRRLQVLVLEWSPRVLMDVVRLVADSPSISPRTSAAPKIPSPDNDEDVEMMDNSNEAQIQQNAEMKQRGVENQQDVTEMRINWDDLPTFSGQLRVVIIRGIGPHISSSAFKWLLSNSHGSLQHLTISRKDPTRCQRPGCGACTLWKFQACAQCKMATYCSRRCQKRHWRNHKSICQECANSPRDRMVFDDTLLGSIIRCTNLIRLDLSRTFRLDDRQLVTIAQHCTKLIDVSLDGNHHITDRGVEPFVRALPNLHTLRLNVCSHIGNQTIEALSQTCAEHLTVLELGCCHRVSESALMDLVTSCTKLQSLNIACGFQRRQILWNFSDELALLILDHLVHLKVLYVVSTISLSDDVRRKLDEHENLRVYSALTLAPPLDPHQVHVDHPAT